MFSREERERHLVCWGRWHFEHLTHVHVVAGRSVVWAGAARNTQRMRRERDAAWIRTTLSLPEQTYARTFSSTSTLSRMRSCLREQITKWR